MKHSHEFSNEFFWLANRMETDYFFKYTSNVFPKYRGREGGRGLHLRNDSCEENIISTISGLVQIPYIHISPAIVNFSIANFHDRALTVIS